MSGDETNTIGNGIISGKTLQTVRDLNNQLERQAMSPIGYYGSCLSLITGIKSFTSQPRKIVIWLSQGLQIGMAVYSDPSHFGILGG